LEENDLLRIDRKKGKETHRHTQTEAKKKKEKGETSTRNTTGKKKQPAWEFRGLIGEKGGNSFHCGHRGTRKKEKNGEKRLPEKIEYGIVLSFKEKFPRRRCGRGKKKGGEAGRAIGLTTHVVGGNRSRSGKYKKKEISRDLFLVDEGGKGRGKQGEVRILVRISHDIKEKKTSPARQHQEKKGPFTG